MDNILTLVSLTATFCACFYLLYREIKTMEQCMRDDMRQQAERTDRLYEMFIELIKTK